MSLTGTLLRDYASLMGTQYFQKTADLVPLHDMVSLFANGAFFRNTFAGEGLISVTATGDFDLPTWTPLLIDNAGNRISGFNNANGGTLTVQFRFLLQVSQASLTLTPKVYDTTAGSDATTSGALACSATAADFSGTRQKQTLALTLPSAKHEFRPRITIGGTFSAGDWVRVVAVADCYVDV